MTIFNNVDIDGIYVVNPIKQNNKPGDKILHVISMISNPAEYTIRYKLFNDFKLRN